MENRHFWRNFDSKMVDFQVKIGVFKFLQEFMLKTLLSNKDIRIKYQKWFTIQKLT